METSKKSFWKSPESVAAWAFVGGVGASAIYLWAKILPFLLEVVADTFKLSLLAGGLTVFFIIAASPKTRLIFRLLSRAVTGLIINIDPIGILKDRIAQMKKRKESMEEQIGNVLGQIGVLKNAIEKNKTAANENMNLAAKAQERASRGDFNMALQVKVKANKAGRLEKSNLSYSQLLTKLQSLYDLLSKWSVHTAAYIEDTEDEVRQAEVQYKTVNAAYKAFSSAMSVIRGNGVEEDTYTQTMEALAEQAGQKLGEIDDFQRQAQGFMDGIDLKNDVVTDDAMKKLEAYQQKLLLPGTPTFLTDMPAGRDAVDATYTELFKR